LGLKAFYYTLVSFLKKFKPSVTQPHYRNTRARIYRFLDYLKNDDPELLTPGVIQRYLDTLPSDDFEPSTVRVHKSAISAFCGDLVRLEIIPYNPCNSAKTTKPNKSYASIPQ